MRGGTALLGLVCYRGAGEKNGPRTLLGARFLAVYIARGEGPGAYLSAYRAAKYLKKRRVRQAVFPRDYPYRAVFARFGVLAPDERPLRQVKAAEIIRCAMAKRALRADRARIALVSSVPSAALETAAAALARDVRYLTLCTPNAARIARALRWDCGAGVAAAGEKDLCADLAACFGGEGRALACPVLPVESAALTVLYGAAEVEDAMEWDEDQLLCALYAAAALRAEEIFVKDVIFPAKPAENANLP